MTSFRPKPKRKSETSTEKAHRLKSVMSPELLSKVDVFYDFTTKTTDRGGFPNLARTAKGLPKRPLSKEKRG